MDTHHHPRRTRLTPAKTFNAETSAGIAWSQGQGRLRVTSRARLLSYSAQMAFNTCGATERHKRRTIYRHVKQPSRFRVILGALPSGTVSSYSAKGAPLGETPWEYPLWAWPDMVELGRLPQASPRLLKSRLETEAT